MHNKVCENNDCASEDIVIQSDCIINDHDANRTEAMNYVSI